MGLQTTENTIIRQMLQMLQDHCLLHCLSIFCSLFVRFDLFWFRFCFYRSILHLCGSTVWFYIVDSTLMEPCLIWQYSKKEEEVSIWLLLFDAEASFLNSVVLH